jgi:hypothetical protein
MPELGKIEGLLKKNTIMKIREKVTIMKILHQD